MKLLKKFSVKQTSNTSLMIKGSWNQQITSWSKSHSHHRAVTFHNDISRSLMDYMWNNLSMATQQYLGKYCLAPQHPTISEGQHGPTIARKSKRTSACDSELFNSETFRGCEAPPPTPEPVWILKRAINSEEIFLQEYDWPKVMGGEDCSEWKLKVRISLWNC